MQRYSISYGIFASHPWENCAYCKWVRRKLTAEMHSHGDTFFATRWLKAKYIMMLANALFPSLLMNWLDVQ